MMAMFMSIASYAMAVGGGEENLDIFSKDFGEPRQLEVITKLQCKFDKVQISYATNSNHRTAISSIKLNNSTIKKENLENLNKIIDGSEIYAVRWMRCPDSKRANSPIIAYLFTSMGNPFRFIEIRS